MALSCPNKSLPEWKRLVDEVGEREALNDYFQFGTIRSPYAVKDKLERLNIANYTNKNFKIGERYFKPTVESLIDVEKNSSVVDAMVTHFGYRGLQSEEDLIKRKFTDDIRPVETVLTKPTTTTTKSQTETVVQELFESDPKLANEVYAALGFTGNIIQDNKSYYRGQYDEPIIDNNGNLILKAKEDNLYKRAGLKSFGVSLTRDLKSAEEYGEGQLLVRQNLKEDELGYDRDTWEGERELAEITDNGYYLIQIIDNISNEIIKESGEVKAINDVIVPKGKYKIQHISETIDEITLQQKQEAQKLYSQYLEQNPNGDIQGFKEFVGNKSSQVENIEAQAVNWNYKKAGKNLAIGDVVEVVYSKSTKPEYPYFLNFMVDGVPNINNEEKSLKLALKGLTPEEKISFCNHFGITMTEENGKKC